MDTIGDRVMLIHTSVTQPLRLNHTTNTPRNKCNSPANRTNTHHDHDESITPASTRVRLNTHAIVPSSNEIAISPPTA